VTPTHELLTRISAALDVARDPLRAPAAAAYMRNQFDFAGIRMPGLRAIYRDVTSGRPAPDEADLVSLAMACWALPEREYQYFAVMDLVRHVRRLSPEFVPTLETLVTTRSWWDTVDELATNVAGELVRTHPELRSVMDRWIDSANIWLVRVAILHQERWKSGTDAAVLFDYCLRRAGEREFFIRKAIGWALRSYAKVAPETVAGFISAHGHVLAGLSCREAERGIAMGRHAARDVTELTG
jgi:3-methyladenine DNA glycosylase AlkD